MFANEFAVPPLSARWSNRKNHLWPPRRARARQSLFFAGQNHVRPVNTFAFYRFHALSSKLQDCSALFRIRRQFSTHVIHRAECNLPRSEVDCVSRKFPQTGK